MKQTLNITKDNKTIKSIKLFETFAGMGSQFEALKNIKLNPQPVGYVEWFITAILTYEIIHHGKLKKDLKTPRDEMVSFLGKYNFSSDSKSPVSKTYWNRMSESKIRSLYPYLYRSIVVNNNLVDITMVQKIPTDIDVLSYSFPCQDLSQQGKQKGIEKNTRSGLLWEIERILKSNKANLPEFLLLENVMALVSKKFIDSLTLWKKALRKLGYHSEYMILNSADFGSAQNRKRVFMVSRLNNKNISWPDSEIAGINLKNIIDKKETGRKVNLDKYKFDGKRTTASGVIKQKILNYSNFNSENYIYYQEGKGPTLTASGANSRIKLVINGTIRYMSAKEAYKYMGFKWSDYKKVMSTKLVTDNKSIFLCGNSISVQVLEWIFKEMFNG